MERIIRGAVFLTIVMAAYLGAAQVAMAQEKEEKTSFMLAPVVVKAEKRAEEAQDVPASMSVFEQSDIQNMNIKGTADLARYVPNMAFHDFGSRRHGLLSMRGIKSLPGGQSGTGFTIDGLSYSKAYMFMGLPLFDIDRIEVLRGAQGTLYGRNTTGGVVNLYTADPGEEFSSTVSASYGSYNSRELRVNMSGPLIEDRLYMGVYSLFLEEDSYLENDVDADGRDGRHKSGKAGRVKLRYHGSDDWKTTFILEGQHHDDGAFPMKRTKRNTFVKNGTLPADRRYHYSHDFEGTENVSTIRASVNSELETDIGTLQSITGYQTYDMDEWIDADASPFDVMRKRIEVKDNDFSQEFRLTSPEGEEVFQWLTGLHFYHFDGGNDITNNYGVQHPALAGAADSYDTTLRNTGGALFGQGTYTFFSCLDLTLGVRGEYELARGESTWERRTASGAVTRLGYFDEAQAYTAVLPKAALSWHITDDVMTYGTVAKGHKVGGYNSAWVPDGAERYGEEDSWLYEVGVKSFLLDKRLMVNVAAFYTTIENEQLTLFVAGTRQGYLANAGESHRTGLEVESRFKLSDVWTVSGTGSWIDARFDDYEDTANGIDYSGNNVFCVPEYSYSVALEYCNTITDDWTVFGRAALSGVGPQYFDNGNEVRQNAYELVGLRVGAQWKGFEGSLWVENLFDQHYIAFENTVAGFAEDGRPRTFGASLAYTF